MKPGTSDFTADGVVFYPSALLSGYCALFKEAGDELSFSSNRFPMVFEVSRQWLKQKIA
jgi:hypothetical protein